VPPLSTDLFDFALPNDLIAQKPAEKRDLSRLLVVDRTSRTIHHRTFSDLPEYLVPGDTLIRNTAAVLPARLNAYRTSGGEMECLLLRPTSEANVWWCLLRPGKKLPLGAAFSLPGAFSARVLEKDSEGTARVSFETEGGGSIVDVANRLGSVPLPPYITRKQNDGHRTFDLSRYQTVYADPTRQVAVAAPTAGLHFTTELLTCLANRGVAAANVVLHVGLGTFKPIATESIEDHPIHRECYEMPVATQKILLDKQSGRRVAVGTTTVRAIESFLRQNPSPSPANQSYVDEAALYLVPPCQFLGVDSLITNFHQPRSTLLCLVSAFLTPGSTDGIRWLKEIYEEAIRSRYRFFSYGDAMLIL
jgi:S-adenosylmethionine:tRNA ribosyltransferase-isomerase